MEASRAAGTSRVNETSRADEVSRTNEVSRTSNIQTPPPSPTIPTIKKSNEDWSASSLQEYVETQMEEENIDAISHTDI